MVTKTRKAIIIRVVLQLKLRQCTIAVQTQTDITLAVLLGLLPATIRTRLKTLKVREK